MYSFIIVAPYIIHGFSPEQTGETAHKEIYIIIVKESSRLGRRRFHRKRETHASNLARSKIVP